MTTRYLHSSQMCAKILFVTDLILFLLYPPSPSRRHIGIHFHNRQLRQPFLVRNRRQSILTMLTTISNLLKIILLLTLTAIIVLLFWKAMIPSPPPIPLERLKAANDAAKLFVEDLREHRGNAKTVIVLHLANDPDHCLTQAIRGQIRESGILSVANTPWKEHFMTTFNLPFEGCDNGQEAMRLAEATSQDLLVWGMVESFETNAKGEVVVNGMIHIIDAVSLESIVSCPLTNITAEIKKQEDPPESQKASLAPTRLATFLLLAILFSSMLFPIIRRLVALRSPELNLVLLLILSAVDTALAATILSDVKGFLSSFWFLVIVLFISLICNLMLLNHATRQPA